MKKCYRSFLSAVLAVLILCSWLSAPITAHGFDRTLDISLDGVQNFAMAAEVLELMNAERAANGLPALTADSVLTDYAMQRAAESYLYFSHTRPNGKDCMTIFESQYDYGTKGENIAIGQGSAEDVMEAWMNSEGHRANILDSRFQSVGIGCFYQPDGSIAWVQLFYSGTSQETENRKNVQEVNDVQISAKSSKLLGQVTHYTFSNAYCAAYLYAGTTIGTSFCLVNPLFTHQKIYIDTENVKYNTSDSEIFTVNNTDHTINAKAAGKARLSVVMQGAEISVLDDAGYVQNNITVEVLEKPALHYSFDDRGNILIDYSEFNSTLDLFYKGNRDDMWIKGNREADQVYTHYDPDPTETYVYVMRYYDPHLDDFVEIGDRLIVQLGNEDPNPDPNPDPDPDPDPEPNPGVELPPIPDRDGEPSVTEALDILQGLQTLCPAGTEWTLQDYQWLGGSLDVLGYTDIGSNDTGFCMAISDRVFGDLPARVISDVDFNDLRPGDILMDSIYGNMIVVDMSWNYIYCATVEQGVVRYHLFNLFDYTGYVVCALTRYESQTPGVQQLFPQVVPEDANIVSYGDAHYSQKIGGENTYYAVVHWMLDDAGILYFDGKGKLIRTSVSTWGYAQDQVKGVVIGPNITEIDTWAFENFYQLEKVELGPDLRTIGYGAFESCYSLHTVTFGNGLQEIGDQAFQDCALQSVEFPSGLTVIGNNAFLGNDFETLRLPEGLISIGDSAFSDNEKLEHLSVPSTLREMGRWVFSDCAALRQLELAEGLAVLGDYAFSGSTSLKTVTIPGSLTRIPQNAFAHAGLETVYFQQGVQVIGAYAFYQCRQLTSFYVYNTLTGIEDAAFDGCEQLWDVYFYGNEAQWNAVEIGLNNTWVEMFAWIHYLDPNVCIHQNVAVIPGRAPTCTADGLSEGTVCADCGEILQEQQTLPALGHDWSDWEEIQAPTHEQEGLREHTCQRCGHTEQEAIPPIAALPGDVNGDGRVNARDARLLLRYAAGLAGEDEIDLTAADFNGDGRVNARDARAILRAVAGID